MPDTLYIALDRSRLRAFRQAPAAPGRDTAAFESVESIDFPEGRIQYHDTDTDAAGRFPSAAGPGMSIDERLPMKQEHQRRLTDALGTALGGLLDTYADAGWHLAAGPDLLQPVLDLLSPAQRARLRSQVGKNIAHLPTEEIQRHFA